MERLRQGKLYYILYNNITDHYSSGQHKYRLLQDPVFSDIGNVVARFGYWVHNRQLNRKRKMTIITNAPREDFDKLRKGLEGKLKNARFINETF